MKFWLFGFLFSTFAQAASLPPQIIAAQQLKVTFGECQPEWRTIAGIESRDFDLGRGVTLWLIPCARWAVNENWTAYLTIKESHATEGYVTRALTFVNYSLNQKLVGETVLHNPIFDPLKLTLEQTYYPTYTTICKSSGLYKWDPGQQTFLLQQLYKYDNCRTPGAMEQLYP